jgi:predicted dehydrogenase
MAIDLTPEQREVGRENFARTAEGLNRRGFMKSLAAGAGGVAALSAAGYFGYAKLGGNPVKAALIGGGDEGGVLVGEHNPDFLEFVAVADIRPSNLRRIFVGEPAGLRKGFKKIYGKEEAERRVKKYTDYRQMLRENPEVEAVVIAVPLHLHAPIAVEAMRIGQQRGKPIHVLCEKLMAWNIGQCKQMVQAAKETGSILSIGHQRHYSLLYAHAHEVMAAGVLGDVKHIRALWHRNNAWPYVADEKEKEKYAAAVPLPYYRDGWYPPVLAEDYDALADRVKPYGYDSVEQLVRWRLYDATGGGLMAELGSHQLDACSIFLGKKRPLAVTAVGGKYFYGPGRNDRDCEDHVFCTYEFPGKNHATDRNDRVVVTYSSVSTNAFEQYGECVLGDRGTMVVEGEQSVMLYTERDPNKKVAGNLRGLSVGVSSTGAGKPALESTSTWGPATGAAPGGAGGPPIAGAGGPVSRGYREEMEDFAYCVRLWDPKLGYKGEKGPDGKFVYEQRLPRCHGEVAMADAVVALTANRAMKRRERIEFKDAWFDAGAPEVPDGDAQPKVPVA